jgi:glycosyltransferase involved in cell wall biosynthesis
VPQSLRKADGIIAVSRSTALDLRQLFNIDRDRVNVIYNGFDVSKIPLKRRAIETIAKFKLPKRYFLFVGTIEPRKNIIMLLRTFKQLLEHDSECNDVVLVLAGQPGYHHEEVMQAIFDLKLKRNIRYLGYVTHNEKVELLKHALGFVFPTLYEGFGLPVLEAMALGVPTITSNNSSMPEIVGKAAVLVDPKDQTALARAMKDFLHKPSLTQRLHIAGPKQAANFSWETCASQTMAVYKKVVGKK